MPVVEAEIIICDPLGSYQQPVDYADMSDEFLGQLALGDENAGAELDRRYAEKA